MNARRKVDVDGNAKDTLIHSKITRVCASALPDKEDFVHFRSAKSSKLFILAVFMTNCGTKLAPSAVAQQNIFGPHIFINLSVHVIMNMLFI